MQPQDQLSGPLSLQVGDLGKRIEVLEETLSQLKTLDVALREMQFIIFNYVEKINEGVVLIQDEILVWANSAACKILGYTLDEVINKSVIGLAHPKYRDQLSARFAMVQAGDTIPGGVLWPLISKSREIKYARPFSYRVMYKGRPAIMAFYHDVTEDKKAQEELAMRAEMLDLVSDSVFLHDMHGNIKYVNKAACKSLGYTAEEIINMNVVDINAEELRRKAKIRVKLVSSQKESRFKTVQVRKDGSRMPVDVRSKVIETGGQRFILGVVREITPEEVENI
jgi:PAS domain S-box-containing protein